MKLVYCSKTELRWAYLDTASQVDEAFEIPHSPIYYKDIYFHKQSPLDKISLHSRVVSLVVYISWEWKHITYSSVLPYKSDLQFFKITLDVSAAVSLYPGDVVAVIVWLLDLQLPMQSVPITTDVVSSNLYQDGMYISDLWQVDGFLQFPPPIKLTATL